ncbi:unnamed protein product [Protopolystoma xenopodis]|uniref:Uncharacterized protein n=1 Tax=Protopolystoma xenopodis TaxID=117903 RepID=A0A3S5AEC4_9PLAT|nr:unnamed protein product [Protopolystoma xenopodis]
MSRPSVTVSRPDHDTFSVLVFIAVDPCEWRRPHRSSLLALLCCLFFSILFSGSPTASINHEHLDFAPVSPGLGYRKGSEQILNQPFIWRQATVAISKTLVGRPHVGPPAT